MPKPQFVNNPPSVAIIYFTFDRLAYTKKSLKALLRNTRYPFELHIVDNGSGDGTPEYLRAMRDKHPDIIKSLTLNHENRGLAAPTNEFWQNTDTDLVGKVDNDTLVPEGWLTRLARAHMRTDRIGTLGAFHFMPEDVESALLEKRRLEIDGVELMPDTHISGCCYLMKRRVQRETGLITVYPNRRILGFPEYQERIRRAGYVNGYLLPLLFVESMDDPRSKHCLLNGPYLDYARPLWRERGVLLADSSIALAWLKRDAKRMMTGKSLADAEGHIQDSSKDKSE